MSRKNNVNKKNVKKSGLKYYFNDGLKYIRESRKYIYTIIGIFFLFALFAFFIPGPFGFLNEMLKDLVDKTEGLNTAQITVFILNNNLQSAVFGFILGIFFGVFPIFNAVLNGSVLGYVFGKVYAISGFSDFWRILPHGIFELPAIFIALGLGLKLGASFFSGDIKKSLRERFVRGGRSFILIVIPLLIIAAIIEGILIGLMK